MKIAAGLLALPLLAGLAPEVRAEPPNEFRLALEDTWIDGLASTTIHGAEPSFEASPATNSWIYLKFDLTGFSEAIVTAELRLTRFAGDRPEEIFAYLIEDDAWTEAALDGPSRPAPQDPLPATALGSGYAFGTTDYWNSQLLLAAVRQEAAGDGTLSLMLRDDEGTLPDARSYRSREAAVSSSRKPQLALLIAPGEASGLRVSGISPPTLAWTGANHASTHDVASGRLSDLVASGAFASATCIATYLGSTSYSDPRPDPAAGDGDYYLVRGRSLCCVGAWGNGSGGSARTLSVCP